MARNRSALRNHLEYVAARGIFLAARVVPDSGLRPFSRVLGWMLSFALRGRRRVVAENLQLARTALVPLPDALAITRSSFSNLCLSFLELARLPEDRTAMKARIRFRDPSAWTRLTQELKNGPVVFVASHFGAYEVGGLVSPLHDVTLHTMMRPLDNPRLEGWLSGIRTRFGQFMISNRGGYGHLEAALDRGISVALLVDVNKRGHCCFVDFLGTPAATARSSALLAIRSGRPIVPVYTYRALRPLHYEVEIEDTIRPTLGAERGAEVARLLQCTTDTLAARVKRDPSAWLWTHRRWKSRPEAGTIESETDDEQP